jgi:DNA modification methylase
MPCSHSWVSECGRVELYCGDSLTLVSPKLTGIDVFITDPPYGVGLKGKRAKQRNGKVTTGMDGYCFVDDPDHIKGVVVPVIGMCLSLAPATVVTPGTRCMHLYPIPDEVGCFYSAAGTGMGRWGFSCMQPILYYGKDPYLARSMGARANSCGQTYPNDANQQDHPCAKPMPWAQWLVARSSFEGETVCDPFMGSGTTGVAAIRGGRRFVGIDIDPKHFETAKARLQRELAQGDLFFDANSQDRAPA